MGDFSDPSGLGPYGPLILTVALLAAWLATDLLIPWVTRLAYRFGRVDPVDARKVHKTPIPRLGGIAIYLGVMLTLALVEFLTPGTFFPIDGPLRGVLAGGTLVFAVGILDDLFDLPAKVKLLGQIGAACLAFGLGLHIDFVSQPGGGLWPFPIVHGFPLLALLVTVFWIVAITNTINLIDGLDGLAGGVSLIGALTLAIIALDTKQPFPVIAAVAVSGATIGFLRYNFNPARIFMGDGGSLFLGFTLASISILGVFKLVTAVTLILPLLILGVPIGDTVFAIVRRLWHRKPIFSPDRGHLHHRLLSAGLSHRNAVIMIYGLSLALAGLALSLLHIEGAMPMLFASFLFLLWGGGNLALSRLRGVAARPGQLQAKPAVDGSPSFVIKADMGEGED
ncbi:MAG: undecaprenyl/decaprenyl-phosphate alpha-N-acetylglucosaminyl 1-phosphate transferase [Cyanobacteria bacterium REEB65]|nr:undecaprenyl/decaprenyl-phosphate alpha-N-acetylglucosaminyl 1-phosphate transferase [Cyanobacteria bacterium REEB65]